jgi:regulator of sigma E protease
MFQGINCYEEFFLSILYTIIALAILVTIHEGGHFLAAKLMGVYVEKFSIGFGPKLFSFKFKETEYIIALIPLGGYVKMKAENPSEKNLGTDDEFEGKKWWQKVIIAFAGPFANFILAVILLTSSSWIGKTYQDQVPIIGKILSNSEHIFKINDKIIEANNFKIRCWSDIITHTNNNNNNHYTILRSNKKIDISSDIDKKYWYENILPKAKAIVGEVAPGLPAYSAGLKSGDKICAVDSIPINSWYEMRALIINNKKDKVKLKIERNGHFFYKNIDLQTNVMNNSKIIGITQKLPINIVEKFGFFSGIKFGLFSSIGYTIAYYRGLGKLIMKPSSIKDNIGGPVMLYSISKQTAKRGFDAIISLFSSISLMLMVMNLLPIPILDGGQILFYIIEGIMKKPLNIKIQIALQNFGLLILLFLMLFAFYNDFSKLFVRHNSLINTESTIK